MSPLDIWWQRRKPSVATSIATWQMATKKEAKHRHFCRHLRNGDNIGIPALEFQPFKRGILVISCPFRTLAFQAYKFITIFPFWQSLDNQETSFSPPFLIQPFFLFNNHLDYFTPFLCHFPYDSTYLDTSSTPNLCTRFKQGSSKKDQVYKRDPMVISLHFTSFLCLWLCVIFKPPF